MLSLQNNIKGVYLGVLLFNFDVSFTASVDCDLYVTSFGRSLSSLFMICLIYVYEKTNSCN